MSSTTTQMSYLGKTAETVYRLVNLNVIYLLHYSIHTVGQHVFMYIMYIGSAIV